MCGAPYRSKLPPTKPGGCAPHGQRLDCPIDLNRLFNERATDEGVASSAPSGVGGDPGAGKKGENTLGTINHAAWFKLLNAVSLTLMPEDARFQLRRLAAAEVAAAAALAAITSTRGAAAGGGNQPGTGDAAVALCSFRGTHRGFGGHRGGIAMIQGAAMLRRELPRTRRPQRQAKLLDISGRKSFCVLTECEYEYE